MVQIGGALTAFFRQFVRVAGFETLLNLCTSLLRAKFWRKFCRHQRNCGEIFGENISRQSGRKKVHEKSSTDSQPRNNIIFSPRDSGSVGSQMLQNTTAAEKAYFTEIEIVFQKVFVETPFCWLLRWAKTRVLKTDTLAS